MATPWTLRRRTFAHALTFGMTAALICHVLRVDWVAPSTAAIIAAVPRLPGGWVPGEQMWARRKVRIDGHDRIEDSIDLGSAGGAPPAKPKKKRLRILRNLLSVEEAQVLLQSVMHLEFSATENLQNPVVTPFEMLAASGDWLQEKHPTALVQKAVEERLLPYLREELECASLHVETAMIRRYTAGERLSHDTHFDFDAFGTVVMDLTPKPGSGLFLGVGVDAYSQFFVPFDAPGDAAVHGWDVAHGVHLERDHSRVSLIIWLKPAADVDRKTTSWYEADAKAGSADAVYRLGLQAQIDGMSERARDLFLKAAENDHPYAKLQLSWQLSELGQPRAKFWLVAAATTGFPHAQLCMGDAMRQDGAFPQANTMYELAASQDDYSAQLRLAAALTFGLGTKLNAYMAWQLLVEAAVAEPSVRELVAAVQASGQDGQAGEVFALWSSLDRGLQGALRCVGRGDAEVSSALAALRDEGKSVQGK